MLEFRLKRLVTEGATSFPHCCTRVVLGSGCGLEPKWRRHTHTSHLRWVEVWGFWLFRVSGCRSASWYKLHTYNLGEFIANADDTGGRCDNVLRLPSGSSRVLVQGQKFRSSNCILQLLVLLQSCRKMFDGNSAHFLCGPLFDVCISDTIITGSQSANFFPVFVPGGKCASTYTNIVV